MTERSRTRRYRDTVIRDLDVGWSRVMWVGHNEFRDKLLVTHGIFGLFENFLLRLANHERTERPTVHRMRAKVASPHDKIAARDSARRPTDDRASGSDDEIKGDP